MSAIGKVCPASGNATRLSTTALTESLRRELSGGGTLKRNTVVSTKTARLHGEAGLQKIVLFVAR